MEICHSNILYYKVMNYKTGLSKLSIGSLISCWQQIVYSLFKRMILHPKNEWNWILSVENNTNIDVG